MNPFLYKAHPLLLRLIGLFTEPAASSLGGKAELVLLMLGLNLFWTLALVWAARKADGLRLPLRQGYVLALPACLLYTPLVLTVVGDVVAHSFRFQDRLFLVFAILAASQTLAAFYAFALRHRPSGHPVGLAAGFAVSLILLLFSLPVSLGLLGLNSLVRIF
jgi:hypothetical protein